MCCAVSVSILQNLQDGSSLNKPTVRRCPLTGACPMGNATANFSWCLFSLSRSSALFLHSLLIKSLLCLQPGISFQVISTLSLTSALDADAWWTTRPGRFIPGKETRYQLYRGLGGIQVQYGRVRKISRPPPPTGIRSPYRPARSESLYRLRYPDPSPVQSLYRRILCTNRRPPKAGVALPYLILICANRGQIIDLESETRTNNPCQYVSSDFEDRRLIKFVQDRVHSPQVPIDGAEHLGNRDMRHLTTGIRF
jgi:hypothetical protein